MIKETRESFSLSREVSGLPLTILFFVGGMIFYLFTCVIAFSAVGYVLYVIIKGVT